jgi:hypothetical protein
MMWRAHTSIAKPIKFVRLIQRNPIQWAVQSGGCAANSTKQAKRVKGRRLDLKVSIFFPFSLMTGPNIPPSQMSLRPEQFEELKSLFRSFDRNHDGIISRDELYNVLTSMGMRPNDEQLDAMVKEETYPESIYECQR